MGSLASMPIKPTVNISVDKSINVSNITINITDPSRAFKPSTRSTSMTSTSMTSSTTSLNEITKIKSNNKSISTTSRNIALIICNSYEHTRFQLGESAHNDGLLAYHNLKQKGFDTFLYHDVNCRQLKAIFNVFLSSHSDRLVIYYIDNGVLVKDKLNDEQDGYDEAMFCVDGGLVIDDELIEMIKKYNNCKQLILISDCCHNGTCQIFK